MTGSAAATLSLSPMTGYVNVGDVAQIAATGTFLAPSGGLAPSGSLAPDADLEVTTAITAYTAAGDSGGVQVGSTGRVRV